MTLVVYLDASAILKLVVDEPESSILRGYLAARQVRATSVVGTVETRRNARKRGGDVSEHVTFVLGGIEVIELGTTVVDRATAVSPPTLRSLDAIHVASALELGSDLEALVTYDGRMIDAALALGLPVVSPGTELAG